MSVLKDFDYQQLGQEKKSPDFRDENRDFDGKKPPQKDDFLVVICRP